MRSARSRVRRALHRGAGPEVQPRREPEVMVHERVVSQTELAHEHQVRDGIVRENLAIEEVVVDVYGRVQHGMLGERGESSASTNEDRYLTTPVDVRGSRLPVHNPGTPVRPENHQSGGMNDGQAGDAPIFMADGDFVIENPMRNEQALSRHPRYRVPGTYCYEDRNPPPPYGHGVAPPPYEQPPIYTEHPGNEHE